MPRHRAAEDPFQHLSVEGAEEVLRSLIDHLNGAYLEVGALLSRVGDIHGPFDRKGAAAQHESARTKAATGVSYRKARYLISIHRAFAPLGAGADRLRGLGWAKAKEIARVPPEHLAPDLDTLVDFALNHGRDELIDHLNVVYGIGRGA